MKKIRTMSVKLNFTPNTLDCYGLNGAVGSIDTPFDNARKKNRRNINLS